MWLPGHTSNPVERSAGFFYGSGVGDSGPSGLGLPRSAPKGPVTFIGQVPRPRLGVSGPCCVATTQRSSNLMLMGVADESCLYPSRSAYGDAMTRALAFTQAAAERAIKAVRKQGMSVTGMTVKPDGAITIHMGDNPSPSEKPLADAGAVVL
jgi:hypothetical protein